MKNRNVTPEVACVLMVALLASAAFGALVAAPLPDHDALATTWQEPQASKQASDNKGEPG